MTRLLIVVLIIVGGVNAYILLKKETYFVLATEKQMACVERVGSEFSSNKTIGPGAFEKLFVLEVYRPKKDDFRVELSSCFGSWEALETSVEHLNSRIKHMRSLGAKDIYFYKHPDQDLFSIYASD
jgi:hypothetical protein